MVAAGARVLAPVIVAPKAAVQAPELVRRKRSFVY